MLRKKRRHGIFTGRFWRNGLAKGLEGAMEGQQARGFRYKDVHAGKGVWLKGITHTHTLFSDGGCTPREVGERYASLGYDFVFITDHNSWFPPRGEDYSEAGAEVLLLDGVELDFTDPKLGYFHVVLLGSEDLRDWYDPSWDISRCVKESREAGVFTVLAHPHWCHNEPTHVRTLPFSALEIYNHITQMMNGKGDSSYIWDLEWEGDNQLHGLAADDSHFVSRHPEYNGGWIHLYAPSKSREGILEALRTGRYFSSTGATICNIQGQYSEDTLEVSVDIGKDDVLRCIGPKMEAIVQIPESASSTAASESSLVTVSVPLSWKYARIEVVDPHGNMAWTNNLFL